MLVAPRARCRAARCQRVGDPFETVRARPFHHDRDAGVQARFRGVDEVLDAREPRGSRAEGFDRMARVVAAAT
jgi:hypothetical protein